MDRKQRREESEKKRLREEKSQKREEKIREEKRRDRKANTSLAPPLLHHLRLHITYASVHHLRLKN